MSYSNIGRDSMDKFQERMRTNGWKMHRSRVESVRPTTNLERNCGKTVGLQSFDGPLVFPITQPTVSKHRPQLEKIIDWPQPFFFHRSTPKERGTAPLTPALQCQYSDTNARTHLIYKNSMLTCFAYTQHAIIGILVACQNCPYSSLIAIAGCEQRRTVMCWFKLVQFCKEVAAVSRQPHLSAKQSADKTTFVEVILSLFLFIGP